MTQHGNAVMQMPVTQKEQVAILVQSMAVEKADTHERLANVRPDDRSFRRLKEFANKRDEWK